MEREDGARAVQSCGKKAVTKQLATASTRVEPGIWPGLIAEAVSHPHRVDTGHVEHSDVDG